MGVLAGDLAGDLADVLAGVTAGNRYTARSGTISFTGIPRWRSLLRICPFECCQDQELKTSMREGIG